ncbi:phosphatidylinositol-3-/phosphoinositide 5-phosphatase INP52 KNAG_0I02010 [Huiozyma naganishii CBS 8797]|uniref:phosphoinositide 5-phosphatase n=1 Tax=Huiozyma naganishii (strain ATCC MYA-139 / BCRC 22969 / CBS 8797 / KCTC 17520 / NBRC 10181 / NCYC 3082 / Yp74L-3) TaxID=1071383 RepID=J7SAA4_HUIN7|nr:hypothetical protein KNAG_0I02010 [Kazachstania naganishii CBS 8797]CCK71986.1 hypothetical protein KNAG_0I02010 [Kazachstania naganishii CBS 8797]
MQILVSHPNSPRSIALASKSFSLVFRPVRKSEISCAVELVPNHELKRSDYKRLTRHEVHGFIGLISLNDSIFIGTITGSAKVASPTPHETVNKIYAVDFYCLTDRSWDFVDLDVQGRALPEPGAPAADSALQHPCFELKKLLSNGSFYYSSDFDLTSTLQGRGFNTNSLSKDNFEEEFMWNHFMMHDMVNYRDRSDSSTKEILDAEGFLTTVIRGFAETFVTFIKRWKVSQTVISKQSWKRAGTRFNMRGINDEGYVANFVETEFIMYSSEYCYAYTQVRGSVPVFWEQDAALINPKVQITRSTEATQKSFDTHFMKLLNKYGPVDVINLLSEKSSEAQLSRRYKEQLQSSPNFKYDEDVLLTVFDFHKETSQDGFVGAAKILPQILKFMMNAGYFSYDVREDRVISKQQGIFRTNCLDCLDRTNLVQQLISLEVFKLFLHDFEILDRRGVHNELDFVQRHNSLWADHGDQISQIYTGTNALKSSFSRKGKMSFAGTLSDATKSVSRMYINNFMDKNKQLKIDGLLGRLPDQKPVSLYDPENEFVTTELEKRSDSFTSYSNMNLFVGTFNVNNLSNRSSDLSKWLFPIGNKFKPDVVVLGLQEVIAMSAGSILNADYTKGSVWKTMVSNCLNQYAEKYILLRVEQMSSILILLFVKEDKINHATQVEGSTKKTGFGGMAGNKGAVAIRLKYGNTSFCFVNSHFAAGAKNVDERANDYAAINKSISFTGGRNISQHECIFWLGDLNFRISLDNLQVRRELSEQKEGYLERLMKYDQLTQAINSNNIFRDFCEPTIQFCPTYKYDFGTDIYDTSEKARTPSWTDRIIYKGNNLQPLAYSDAPLKLSDHKPVYAAYRCKVGFIDEAKKLHLRNELYLDYKNKVDRAGPEHASTFPMEEEKRVRQRLSLPVENQLAPVSLKSRSSGTSLQSAVRSPSELERKNMSLTPPPVPQRKTLPTQRMPPKPPMSRSSTSLHSQGLAAVGSNSSIPDLIELDSLPASEDDESSGVAAPKRPVPPPPPRKPSSQGIAPVGRKETEFSIRGNLPPGETSIDDTSANSSLLEMVIDSSSPKRTRQLLPTSESDSARSLKKTPPAVPAKKPQLHNLEIR